MIQAQLITIVGDGYMKEDSISITVTLIMYPELDQWDKENGALTQSIDVAKVEDGVSIIFHKTWKEHDSNFARLRISHADTLELIVGLLEAMKDDP
jgi:hypothetical protein